MTKIRNLEIDDLTSLVRWRNDPQVNRYLSNRLLTIQDAEKWFTSLTANRMVWLKAIIHDNQLIGYGVVESINTEYRRCELAMVIGETEYWGKGIGSHVIKEMLAYAFDTLKMHRVWGVVAKGNERSERLLKKAGMIHEGVMRETIIINEQFTDLLCFSILEDEYK